MNNFKYYYLMEYVPVRYHATMEQEENRKAVYSFKDGCCPESLISKIVAAVQEIKDKGSDGHTRVCFIPASTSLKTFRRYKYLSTKIKKETGCPCSIDTIKKLHDEESGHIAGKKYSPADDYEVNRTDIAGMNIILIDDVITRGKTFCSTAEKLLNNGAKQVQGLFLAKTVHPCENMSSIS